MSKVRADSYTSKLVKFVKENKSTVLVVFAAFVFFILAIAVFIQVNKEDEVTDVNVAGGYRTPSMVGDANFSKSKLPANMKSWFEKFWIGIQDPKMYPGAYSCASSGNMYMIGRCVSTYTYSVINVFRYTGDLALLDELIKLWNVAKTGLKDVNGDGYKFWLWLQDPDYYLYGTEYHLMDQILSMSGVATFTYALKSNLHLRPDWAPEVAYWQNFMLKDFEEHFIKMKGSWVDKSLMHAYTGFTNYFLYTYKIFGDSWRKQEMDKRLGFIKNNMVAAETGNGIGYFWDHRVKGVDSNPGFGCQPTDYANLTFGFMQNFYYEKIDIFAQEETMIRLKNTLVYSVFRNGVDKPAGSICDGLNVIGVPPEYGVEKIDLVMHIWGNHQMMAKWDTTNKIKDAIVSYYASYYVPNRNYHIPAAMVVYEASRAGTSQPPTVPTYCGDGTVQTPNDNGVNEVCDDGNTVNNDQCSSDCKKKCTSPAYWDGSACKTPATTPVCGNGNKETGEECDDGNKVSGDGCSSVCKTETIKEPGDGTPTTSESSLKFDGVDDYVQISSANLKRDNSTVSMSLWVKPALGGNSLGGMVGSVYGSWYGYGLDMPYSPRLLLRSATGGAKDYSLGFSLDADTWTHVAVTIEDTGSATQIKSYKNGTLVKTQTGIRIGSQGEIFYVGKKDNNNFKGELRQVAIWSKVLSLSDITSAKDNGLSGSESGLIAYWAMDDGSGQVVSDKASTLDGRLGSATTTDTSDPTWVVVQAEEPVVEPTPSPVPAPTPTPTPTPTPDPVVEEEEEEEAPVIPPTPIEEETGPGGTNDLEDDPFPVEDIQKDIPAFERSGKIDIAQVDPVDPESEETLTDAEDVLDEVGEDGLIDTFDEVDDEDDLIDDQDNNQTTNAKVDKTDESEEDSNTLLYIFILIVSALVVFAGVLAYILFFSKKKPAFGKDVEVDKSGII